ncbi:protein of unknown function [Burkholderia multivorans]
MRAALRAGLPRRRAPGNVNPLEFQCGIVFSFDHCNPDEKATWQGISNVRSRYWNCWQGTAAGCRWPRLPTR